MNAGQSRRFPRTSRVTPEAIPKVERDKIRHPEPDAPRAGYGQAPKRASRMYAEAENGAVDQNVVYEAYEEDSAEEETDPDWTVEPEDDLDASSWDEDSEDDWVLDPNQDDAPEDEDEGGIIWEADAFADQEPAGHPDDAFGDQDGRYHAEVEFAGRQDIRPRSPRPAPPPSRPEGLQPPVPRAEVPPLQKPPRRSQPRQRQPRPDWVEPGEPPIHDPPAREASVEPNRRRASPSSAGRPALPSAVNARASGARATISSAAGPLGRGNRAERAAPPPRGEPAARRRQANVTPDWPVMAQYGATRFGIGRRFVQVVAVLIVLVGSWFAFQAIGSGGLRLMINQLSGFMPFSDSSRTASDTSFGGSAAPGPVSAEEALSDLEARSRQQNGEETAPDGPPIPAFKPLPNGG